MAIERSVEEAKEKYKADMGEELGDLFHTLWQEIVWLKYKFTEFVELFASKDSRLSLLNNSAPRFFKLLQDTLWEDVLISIARLTDPMKTMGKKNLTFNNIPNLIDDTELQPQIDKALKNALGASEFCRDWRNRRIAHRDLNLSIKSEESPKLKKSSVGQVRKNLDSLEAVLNMISVHYSDSTTLFDMRGEPGSALCLLHVIKDGLEFEKRREERIRTGRATEDDYKQEV